MSPDLDSLKAILTKSRMISLEKFLDVRMRRKLLGLTMERWWTRLTMERWWTKVSEPTLGNPHCAELQFTRF